MTQTSTSDKELRSSVARATDDGLSRDDREQLREVLIAGIQMIQAQFTERSAGLERFRTKCLKEGQPAKRKFFDAQADHAAWRGRTNQFLREVQQAKRHNDAELKRMRVESRDSRVDEVLRQIARKACPHCECSALVQELWREDFA